MFENNRLSIIMGGRRELRRSLVTFNIQLTS